MDEKLRIDVLETSGDKEDISHIPNAMFDQNTATFVKGETMNRDYLNQIYGENMEFLNKEVRLTRTKHYEMREKIENRFNENIKQERKRFVIIVFVYAGLLFISIFLILLAFPYYEIFMDLNVKKYFEGVDGSMLQGTWSAGTFFFTVGWMIFTASSGVLGAFVYSTIKNIKQYKENYKRELKILEENKREQMILGYYDASR